MYSGSVDGLLNWFEGGDYIRDIFVYLLKAFAVIGGLFALYLFVRFWSYIGEFGFLGFLGLLIFQVVFVITACLVLSVIWIRSNTIRDLGSGRYTILPIMSAFSRLIGEVNAILSSMTGLGVTLAFILSGGIPPEFARGLYQVMPPGLRPMFVGIGRAGFGEMLAFFLMSLVTGLFFLMVFYLIAEVLIVLVDIANNTEQLNQEADT